MSSPRSFVPVAYDRGMKAGDSVPLTTIAHASGSLSVVEPSRDELFDIKRVYFIHGVKEGAVRGGHAHHSLEQLIVAVHGSFSLKLENADGRVEVVADNPALGFYIPPGTWRDLTDFSPGAVCLVIASAEYDEVDYVRNYRTFRKEFLTRSAL